MDFISSNLEPLYKVPEDYVLKQGQQNKNLYYVLAGNVGVIAWTLVKKEKEASSDENSFMDSAEGNNSKCNCGANSNNEKKSKF